MFAEGIIFGSIQNKFELFDMWENIIRIRKTRRKVIQILKIRSNVIRIRPRIFGFVSPAIFRRVL